MKQRIITGSIITLLLIPFFFLSGTYLFNVIIAALCGIAAFEIMNCTGQLKKYALSIPALMFAVATPLLGRFSYTTFAICAVIFMFYSFFISVFTNDEIDTNSIGVVFATVFYVTVCFTSIIKLRDIPDDGYLIYILIFVGAWVTDVCAYFTGRLFGKHKLIPKISPKKTIEGAIGGILFCALSFDIFGYITHVFFERSPDYFLLFFIGSVISVVAQLGDLTMSAIKRNYDVKDYGNLFPGHGGVLDRFDSILTLAPFLLMLSGNPDFLSIFK
jgi:CDP-diglyceride synthetase